MLVRNVDGWWPKIRFPYVLCGASNATVVDMRTGDVVEVAEGAWPAGWLDDARYVVTRETAPDVRQATILTVGQTTGAVWGPPFRCGGPVVVFEGMLVFGGHGAYTPEVAGLWRGAPDGTDWQPLLSGVSVYGMSLRVQHHRLAAHLLRADGSEPWVLLDALGQVIATLPSDHLVIPAPASNAREWHGTGYYGRAMLVSADHQTRDVTVTPWAAESVPLPFTGYDGQPWVITATASPALTSVILRPAFGPDVLQLDGLEAAYLDMQPAGSDVWVAGNSDKGLLFIERVDLTAHRAPFRAPPVAQPVPPPPVLGPEGPGPGWVRVNESIDVLRFWGGGAFSRDGSPHVTADGRIYSHPFKGRRETRPNLTGWVQHTKFAAPEAFSVTVFSPSGLGLSFDRTNELFEGYRVVVPGTDETAEIFPRTMRAGDERRTPVEVLDLQTGRRVPWICITRCEGVYAPRAVGSLPAVRHAVLFFGFQSEAGYEEWTTAGENQGPWAWRERSRTSGKERQWEGVFDVPRGANELPPRFTDPPAPYGGGVPVKATIGEPNFPVSVRVGVGVRCVAKVTQGMPTGFQWQRRLAGKGEWWNEHTTPRPPEDTDHTFRFSLSGVYEVRLVTHGVVGVDATSASRKVVVL